MQVSVETIKGLERKLTIQLPAERFEKAYDAKLLSLSKTVKMSGFRAGRVPIKVIRQKYGASVKQEIMDDLVKNGLGEAINKEQLRLAGMPQVDIVPLKLGNDLEFSATFEIFPDITLADFSKLKVKKPQTEIQDKDVENTIDKLRQQRAEWVTVDRAAQKGDQVKIDFEGSIGGEPFEGGSGKDVALVLGSQQMIEGFEDQLEGITLEKERKIKVKFPKDYGNEALRAKKAVFMVTCKEVLEQNLPDIDEDFIKSFGVEDGQFETLQKQLQEHLQREVTENIKIYIKHQILDGLAELHDIELPNVMVDQEIQQLQQQTLQQLGISQDQQLPEPLPREPYEEKAKRQVLLKLVVGEIVKDRALKADPDAIKALLLRAAAGYQNPQQMLEYYMGNKELLKNFEMLALEDKVVELLVSEADVSDESMDFDGLIEANQMASQKKN